VLWGPGDPGHSWLLRRDRCSSRPVRTWWGLGHRRPVGCPLGTSLPDLPRTLLKPREDLGSRVRLGSNADSVCLIPVVPRSVFRGPLTGTSTAYPTQSSPVLSVPQFKLLRRFIV